jgi:signal transduction histidine kinase
MVAGRVPLLMVMIGADQPERGPSGPAERWWPGAIARTESARRWAFDAALAAAVIAVEVGGSHATTAWGHQRHAAPGIAAYVVLVAGGASLLARRRYPVAVLAVTLASALVAVRLGADLVWFALVVAFFTAVLAKKRAAAVGSIVIGYVASVWPPWRIGQPGQTSGADALGLAAGLTLMLAVAELIRIRSQRAAALARSREEELRRLASEERIRMARDLHDVVAHNISVINVQANTALHLMDRQPERARSALTTINDVSKQALIELRSVLGVLRDVDAHGAAAQAPRAPAPGLARLSDLIDNAAAAGLTVRVEEDGRRVPLPADVDLAAYRIIQEALTNSARHSGGANARVRLGYGDHALLVEVDDDGTARLRGGSGHGIAGMTERAATLGGTLEAGPRPEGGFRVRARLPLPRPSQHGPSQHGPSQHGPSQHGLPPEEGER